MSITSPGELSEIIYQHEDYRVELCDQTRMLTITSQHGEEKDVPLGVPSRAPSDETTQYMRGFIYGLARPISDFVWLDLYGPRTVGNRTRVPNEQRSQIPLRKEAFAAVHHHYVRLGGDIGTYQGGRKLVVERDNGGYRETWVDMKRG